MTRACFAIAALLGIALLVLAVWPELDLLVAGLFVAEPDHFVGDTPAGVALRYVLWALSGVLLVMMLAAALVARVRRGTAFHVPRALFLLLTLYAGPGLLVHTTLKEVSHRPRPKSLLAFGGDAIFRPWNRFDGTCRHNCAFPSGEAALAAWTLAPASLAPPPWRGMAVAAALAYAALTGTWRMALGAHFLSDVCGAILLSILVVLACRPLAAPA